MIIPFADLAAQYLAHQTEIDAAIQDVLEHAAFIGGPRVRAFEDAFAAACDVSHCISVANGTDAIYISLKMLGIGPGDEVITTAASWISTSETIGQTGAVPVFVDVDEHHTIDVDLIESAITDRTRAILPVHLYGQACRMDQIVDICNDRDLLLVEDCAQAHLAEYRGRKVGTFGNAGTFSFYPGKNLGAYGDAGAIVTDDDDLARQCRMYANHGALTKHDHRMEGINSRLDGLQAAVLSAKLPHLPAWTRRRQEIALRYRAGLSGVASIGLPPVASGAGHVYHLFVVQVPDRDGLRAYLADRGIETGVHYPTALPFLAAYETRGFRPEQFPVAHRRQSNILSLPIFPEMTDYMVDAVCDAVRSYAAGLSDQIIGG